MEVLNYKDLIARKRVSANVGLNDLFILGQNNPVNIEEYPAYVVKFSDLLAEIVGLLPPPPASTIPVGKQVYIDEVYGSDTTGLRERFDKPFLTPAAAVSASLPGDTIIWRPGTYNIFTNLAKVGVNHYAEEGVGLNIFTVPFNLDTTAGGPVLVGTMSFSGYARVLSSTQPLAVIRTNPLAILNLEISNAQVNNLSNSMVLRDGLTYFTCRNDYSCLARPFSMRNTGNVIANIGGAVSCTFANVNNGVFWNSGTAWSGSAYIKAKTFTLPVTAVGINFGYIYQDNSQGCIIDITLDYLTDTSPAAPGSIININPTFGSTGCKAILRIKNVNLSSRSFFSMSDPLGRLVIQYDTAVGINTGASCADGAVDLKNSHITSNFNIAVGLAGTAVLSLNNTYYKANLTECIRQPLGGNTSLMGSTLVTNGVMPCIDNPAGIVLSEGSKANVAPTFPVTGNLYINPLYVN